MKSLLIKDTTLKHNFVLSSISNAEEQNTNRWLLLLVCLISLSVSAQNEARRWAIDANIGPTIIKNKTGIQDNFGVDNGTVTGFGLEFTQPDEMPVFNRDKE